MDVYIICKNNQYNLLTAWVRRQSKYGMASSFTSNVNLEIQQVCQQEGEQVIKRMVSYIFL